MKYWQIFLIASFTFIFQSEVYAQPWGEQTRNQMLETATLQEEVGNLPKAIEWYEKAYDEERNKDLALKIADLNYQLRDFKRSESWYKRVLSRDKDGIYKEARFGYAKMLKEDNRYNEAIENFGQLMNEVDDPELLAKAKKELQGIQLLNDIEPNVDVIVEFLGKKINSASGEYSPREYEDGTLYYGSLNRKKEIVIDGSDDDYYAKLYMAKRNEEGEFDKGVVLGDEINREKHHNSNLTFSRDGRIMYFTRTLQEELEVLSSEIFFSRSKDGGWSAADPCTGVNGDWIAKQPAMGELYGEEVLFFVSDMDGGLGGFDIYYATRADDGNFNTPVNLGAPINTADDDVTPFYKDGTLYYSSNGNLSIGGFDIYSSTWDGSDWSTPANMGLNYNTSYDDMYFSYSFDGKKGYLVSNRPDEDKKKLKSATCCDDIYGFSIREVVIDLMTEVYDGDTPLEGATIQLINMTDSLNFPTESRVAPVGNSLQFLLEQDHEYVAIAEKEGYTPMRVEFNTVGYLDDKTVKKIFTLDKKPEVIVDTGGGGNGDGKDYVTETVTINQAIRLNNIYYDYDDDKILMDAEKDLNLIYDLLLQYPDMVIELSSHTDSRGISTYNQQLSQRRAQSAVNWLMEKGISEDRLRAVGYGEEFILNHCTNGVRCSDDEHRTNRRTEFKIIEGPQTIEITREVTKKIKNYDGGKQSFGMSTEPVPVMKILNDMLYIGNVKQGDQATFEFEFENTGNADLKIDLVTGCKCSAADWPTTPVAPGEKGSFKVTFDSTGIKLGELEKTMDIIANTDPIVVEAKFVVIVVE